MKSDPLGARNPLCFLPGGVVQVRLTRGKVTLVNLADVPKIAPYRWYALEVKRNWYAATTMRATKRRRPWIVYMHRFLVGGRSPQTDHKNRDGLDNRRANLRPCNMTQNGANRGIPGHNHSGFKGVSWHAHSRAWAARIMVRRREIYLGVYQRREDAARAYDQAALKHFGAFAWLNFPRPHLVKKA